MRWVMGLVMNIVDRLVDIQKLQCGRFVGKIHGLSIYMDYVYYFEVHGVKYEFVGVVGNSDDTHVRDVYIYMYVCDVDVDFDVSSV
jgi:hypothetical protein